MNTPDKSVFKSNVLLQERNIIKHYPEFYKFLVDNHSLYPGKTIQEQMYMYYNDMHEPYKCETCGKYTKFLSFIKGYRRFCCGACTGADPTRIKKSNQTKLERYGDVNYNNREKSKQTCIERYGDANYNNIEKNKQSKLERYGNANYNNREKSNQTCIEKYGNNYRKVMTKKGQQTKLERYGNANYNNREKSNQTCIEKYGDNYREKFAQNAKQTCMEKYGVSNPMKSKEIKEKVKNTNVEKYGVEWGILNKQIRNKHELSRRNFYIKKHNLYNITDDGIWVCKCPHPGCDKCSEKCYEITSIQFYGRKQMNIEPCTKLLPISPNINTGIEQFVRDILDSYNIEYQTNIRSIISPKELDIYIPSKQIAIECNGIFWHSFKEPSYHINKYIECKNKGIQLITLWEDQIKTKPEIVKSIILSKLGIYSTRIYARKCIIKEIGSNILTNFLNENHIQGRTNAKIKLGLYYDNELVSVMTFSKMSKLSGTKNINDNEWELGRFCNKLNTQVIGGASKLLKYFIDNYNPSKIISFASLDISNGNLYKQLGFNKIGNITKAYWYIHKQTYQRYHRSSFTKSKLYAQGYDINMTENEIMSNLPYLKIYDSGHIKYELKIEL